MKKIISSAILGLILGSLAIAEVTAQTGSLPGFTKPVNGVDFNYRSPLPQNEDAYILRNSFETPFMQWQTAVVEKLPQSGMVSFVFMLAMSTDNLGLGYQLETGADRFEFVNNTQKSWSVNGSKGGVMTFYQAKHLPGIEFNGFVILSFPAASLKSGLPLDIRLTMLTTGRNGWIIVFKKSLQDKTTLNNSPVLVKEGASMSQQVTVTQVQFRNPGKVRFLSGGKELLVSETKIGFNRFFVPVPLAKSPRKTNIRIEYENRAPEELSITVVPAKKWEIYLVQHAHTDIGYTRPQSEILAEHVRYMDYALDYCDQTDMLPDDAKFRWTCESTWVVQQYLRTRPQSQIDRLRKRIAEGRIEVTGMYFNMAEIADVNVMTDFFMPLRELRDAGIPVKTMMQNDVNGVAWCLPDYLKNTGVRYLTMGINEARSIRPFKVPTCFWWEGPSGARLLAYRSDHYMTGNNFGLPAASTFDPDKVFDYIRQLEADGYPFNRVAAQFSGYFTDNAPPSTGACDIIRQWNERYESPKLRLAIASEFPEYVEKEHQNDLPVYRNAWLDWWSDGFGSTSRETAKVRQVQNLLRADEGLFAMVSMIGGDLSRDLNRKIEHVSENALFFDEHTVGADESIDQPFSENSTGQWLQKGAYAWEALKKVTLLNEDALGRIQTYLAKASYPVIYVINSLGWDRSGTIQIFVDNQIIPQGKQFRITDLATNKSIPVQLVRNRAEGAWWSMSVENIPSMGWKAFRIDAGAEDIPSPPVTPDNTEMLENQYYKLVFDPGTGSIKTLYDKGLKRDLADPGNPWKIGQPVRETLADRNDMKSTAHSTVRNVKMERRPSGDLYESIKFSADIDGFEKGTALTPRGLEWEVRLYKNEKRIEFLYLGRKEILTAPEALYVAFPFSLPGSRIVFETIGGSLTQGQQLPGSSSDWNVAQDYVSVRGPEAQVVLVSDEIPLWQFGGFNLGKFERYPKAGKPWLFSWVMNNYWTTNFRAFQEGAFQWTYQLTTLTDTTDAAASRFGRGVRTAFLTRTLPPAQTGSVTDPVFRTLKTTGSNNVMLLDSRPSPFKPGSILLNVREMNGLSGNMTIESALPGRPVRKMIQVNIMGDEIGQPLDVIRLAAYEQQFIRIDY
jgi:hypothetical protein